MYEALDTLSRIAYDSSDAILITSTGTNDKFIFTINTYLNNYF